MTAKYFAILTNYGAAQLANAVALGTQMNISAMAVGDGGGTLPVPDPAQTKLVRENRRAAVNQVSVDEKNPNFIIAEQVIPENEGGWWIREIGLFDDTGGLIAVGNAPETYKPNLQEGSGRTQVIQMVLMVSSTQAITLKVDPSVVLATREYVTKSVDAAIQASEARAAQTYQPIGDYVLNPFFKLEMLKKIDKADISQQLGNDTGKVASLHLLTIELGKLQVKGDYALKSDLKNYQPVGEYVDKKSTAVQVMSGELQAATRVGVNFANNKLNALASVDNTATWSVWTGNNFHHVKHPGKSGTSALLSDIPGSGQGWLDLKNQRVVGATYRNPTNKLMFIFVRLGSSPLQSTEIKVNGDTCALWTSQGSTGSTSQGAFTVIGPGDEYGVFAYQGTGNIYEWKEFWS
ncbi:phage tail protein [Morganella morganii subsp. sibonii]|uniref:phage tail protein n=1 Tax=Morganella morganii TaxID=582 RepID=UPI0020231289|nr:phage tail protein [Morganella morganii]